MIMRRYGHLRFYDKYVLYIEILLEVIFCKLRNVDFQLCLKVLIKV